MADADYAGGFTVALNCTTDQYVNDTAICRAIVEQLAQINIKVNLVQNGRGRLGQLIRTTPPATDFYLLGWSVPTFDSEYIFTNLYRSRRNGVGEWNAYALRQSGSRQAV